MEDNLRLRILIREDLDRIRSREGKYPNIDEIIDLVIERMQRVDQR